MKSGDDDFGLSYWKIRKGLSFRECDEDVISLCIRGKDPTGVDEGIKEFLSKEI